MNDTHPHLAALDTFLQALAEDVGAPTNAEVRAYVRAFPDPVLNLWVLHDVTALTERVRHTGTVHARLTGTKVAVLAEHLEVEERTILRKYPRPKVQIRKLPESEPLELYRTATQEALVLELRLDTGELGVCNPQEDPDEAMAHVERVETGVWQRWNLPPLTPEGVNALLRKAKEPAQRLRFGTDLHHDENGSLHAVLDTDAELARREIGQLCAQ